MTHLSRISVELKRGASWLLENRGWVGKRRRSVPHGTDIILMYHRILPIGAIPRWVQPGMYVEADTFKVHLAYLKKHFQVVSLEDISGRAAAKVDRDNHRPRCIITFDDGWKDFAHHAFPLLLEFDLPATVFLPVGYIGTEDWFWTDRIAYLLSETKKGQGIVMDTGIPAREEIKKGLSRIGKEGFNDSTMEAVIKLLKGISEEEINLLIDELGNKLKVPPNPPGRAFLSWEEVRMMADSGLISFGSHTNRHRILVGLGEEEIREELCFPKERLLKELPVGIESVPFCYPNGEYNERIARMVEETGYTLAVTTENGWNDPETDRYRLKRIAIHQDMANTPAMFGCRILRYI